MTTQEVMVAVITVGVATVNYRLTIEVLSDFFFFVQSQLC